MTKLASLIVIFFPLSLPAITKAGLVPHEWLLTTVVQNSSPFAQDFDSISNLVLPFHGSHTAVLGASSATSVYDLSVSAAEDFASYLVQTDHDCINANNVRPRCLEDSFFVFTPETNVVVTFDATYNYSLLANPMSASQSARILLVPPSGPNVQIYTNNQTVSTDTGGPNPGTLSIQDSVFLGGGATYRIDFIQLVTMHAGVPDGAVATADGSYHITVAIPEPSTILGLLPTAFLYRRRRVRHR